ncbi:MAG: DUF2782 domain-containing protein [Pseudomonadota bacterium]
MTLSKVWTIVTLCFLAAAIPLKASAQQPGTVDAPPPKMEKLEEGEAPGITPRVSPSAPQITETRKQGKVTEVKVNTGRSTYYLKPNTPAGSAVPGDAQSDVTRPAQWRVMEFDLNRPKEANATAAPAPATLQPAPAKK